MRVLYIGQYGAGSTSRMRGENLKTLLAPTTFEVIDIDEPIRGTRQPFRSLGWRFNSGPLIGNIASFIRNRLEGTYDLVWVDKGIFLGANVLGEIRAGLKVHYTPDTAIVFNKSRLFNSCIPLYDYCITTKSFEIEAFKQKGAREVLFCTQGYDARVHRPIDPPGKRNGAVFVGLCEPSREEVLAKLIEKKVAVTLAGQNWDKFVARYRNNPSLSYIGKGVFGETYAAL